MARKVLYSCLIVLSALAIHVTAAHAADLQDGAQSENAVQETTAAVTETKEAKKTVKPGWKKKDGKYYWIRKDGTALKGPGMKKLKSKRYFLSKNGSRKTGFVKSDDKLYWFGAKNDARYEKTGFKKIDGKKYCFLKNHSVATGYRKVEKKYYLFSKKGVLYTTDKSVDGTDYFMDEKGAVEAYRKGKTYYHPNGKKMSKLDAYDYDTYQTARKIAAKITNNKMTKAQKLKVCFKWVMKKSYIEKRKYTIAPGWIPLYANDHFKGRGSTCEGDAAAFAYLAKAIGYKDVFVCKDAKDPNSHAWTEIGGKAYDPLFAQNRGFDKHYGASYKKTYHLTPEVHIRMS